MESARLQIEHQATTWLHQRELGPWSEQDQGRLSRWLEASTAHRIVFLRLEAAWEEAGRLKALAPGFPPRTVPTAEQLQLTSIPGTGAGQLKRVPGTGWRWVLVASLLVAVGAGGAWYLQSYIGSYRTPVGGLASIPLEDGTRITLNTASQIRVQITDTQRHIELEQGEAFFDVTKDPARPFTVTAAGKTITVLGTAFSVRRDGGNLRVIVTEGKVKIEENAVLIAGSIARAGGEGVVVQHRSLPEAEEALSWRTGYLVFQDASLPDVAAEFNRYNERKIMIEDPAVNLIRLTGKFRSTNVDALVRLLEKSFNVNARQNRERIFLSAAVDM